MGVEEKPIGAGVVAVPDEPQERSMAVIGGKFTLRDLTTMATAVAASQIFPGIRTQAQAFTLMLLADSMGMHPMTALRQFDMLPNGKPAMKSEALLAQYVAAGGTYKVTERSIERAAGTFTFRANSVDVEFTAEDAKKAGLAGKDNYLHYMADMLFWRMVARGVRSSGSGVGVGIITTEEAQSTVLTVERVPVDADTPGRRTFGKTAIKQPDTPAPTAEPEKAKDPADGIPYEPADGPTTEPPAPHDSLMTGPYQSQLWGKADKLFGSHAKALRPVQDAVEKLVADGNLPATVHNWTDITNEMLDTLLMALGKEKK